MSKLLVIQVAALGYDVLLEQIGGAAWNGLTFEPAASVFPAVTCTVQGTMRTALPPAKHGMVFNGHYSRALRRPMFWEQSSALIDGDRIWRPFREQGKTVGMLFWQQSLGEDVDVLLSPWPVHKHGHGIIDITHSKPEWLYENLCERLERKFRLRHYWGPLAGLPATEFIAGATAEVMHMDIAPDLLFTYLPHLDYDLQRYRRGHRKCAAAVQDLLALLQDLLDAAAKNGYDVVVYGDYAIGPVKEVLFPNRALLDAGLLRVRDVERQLHVNPHESRAFAVVDHEIAHVYVRDRSDVRSTAAALREMGEGFDIMTSRAIKAAGAGHSNSGEIILAGNPGTWFAYPWWSGKHEAPGFAAHIDIHNKPGYDPCELFFGWHPFAISTNTRNVKGTHGSVAAERRVAWAATIDFTTPPSTLLELAECLRNHLTEKAE